MGSIFRPEALSWEDIDGGRGEMTMEAIRNFISEYCYPDSTAPYYLGEMMTKWTMPIIESEVQQIWQ